MLWDLVHEVGQGIIKLGDQFLKKVDLLEQAVHLDMYDIDQPALRRRTGPPRQGEAGRSCLPWRCGTGSSNR